MKGDRHISGGGTPMKPSSFAKPRTWLEELKDDGDEKSSHVILDFY